MQRLTISYNGFEAENIHQFIHAAKNFNIYQLEYQEGERMNQSYLTQDEINDLKETVGHIVMDNEASTSQISNYQSNSNSQHCSPPIPQQFVSEFSKKIVIIDKLAAITLSILDDSSKLLQQNQKLTHRSDQLLNGIRLIQLDYYEIREQNQNLLNQQKQYCALIEVIKKERDSIIRKNQDLYAYLLENNQNYEEEINLLKKQIEQKNLTNQNISTQMKTCQKLMFQQQIHQLKTQIAQLRRTCFQYKRQILQYKHKLQKTEQTMTNLEKERQKHNTRVFQTPPQTNRSMNSIGNDNSMMMASSSLRLQLEDIPPGNFPPLFKTSSHKPVITIQHDSSMSHDADLETQLGVQSHFLIQGVDINKQYLFGENIHNEGEKVFNKKSGEEVVLSSDEKTLKKNIKVYQKSTIQSENNINKNSPLNDSQKLENDLLRKLEDMTKTKPSKLQKMKSMSNILGATQDTHRDAKLIKKYRGELETKHPQLKKFKNKVLEKKDDIIAQGLSRCKSNQLFLKNMVKK